MVKTKFEQLKRLDRKSIDLIKHIDDADDYYRLLVINSQMWILEELITDRICMGNFEEVGRLCKDLRILTKKRAEIKGDEKTY